MFFEWVCVRRDPTGLGLGSAQLDFISNLEKNKTFKSLSTSFSAGKGWENGKKKEHRSLIPVVIWRQARMEKEDICLVRLQQFYTGKPWPKQELSAIHEMIQPVYL